MCRPIPLYVGLGELVYDLDLARMEKLCSNHATDQHVPQSLTPHAHTSVPALFPGWSTQCTSRYVPMPKSYSVFTQEILRVH